MHNDQAYATRQELYVVEVDGVQKSEHRVFVEALKCGMELKVRYPRSKVKLRDADSNAPTDGRHVEKRTWNIWSLNRLWILRFLVKAYVDRK